LAAQSLQRCNDGYVNGMKPMEIGIIGLGRMGGNIARRLMKAKHRCVVFDVNAEARAELAEEGAAASDSLEDLIKRLAKPCAVWIMLPAGRITEETIAGLGNLLAPGDIIIDGGNSFYKDGIRRARMLAAKHIHFIDCGTSGGVWGLDRGYCMMIGGPEEAVNRLDPIFATLAPGLGDIPRTPGREKRDPRAERGYIHAGPSGAGHFVKMVHNGIEYGLMQAYAEGFDILRNKDSGELPEGERLALNMPDIAEVWRRGSVISSWLLDLGAAALAKDPKLDNFTGFVEDSGEGRWTVEAAIEEAVPADVLSSALYARFRSRRDHTFAEKMLSAMRFGFGGHTEGSHALEPPGNPANTQAHATRQEASE
jgi:6-phosphogluconate dehydrogenase